jgi:hypothetical protein
VVLAAGVVVTLGALWLSREKAVEQDAVIAAALFLLLGFLLALLVKTVVDVQADLLLTLVIFLPLLVYLILSGKIANFAAGGVNFTLVVPLNEVSIPNSEGDRLAGQVAPDSGAVTQHRKHSEWCSAQSFTNSVPQPVYLTLKLGGCTSALGEHGGRYSLEDVRRWVQEDTAGGNFKYVIVVNDAGAFHAAIDSLAVAKLLASDEGSAFVDTINNGSLDREEGSVFRGVTFDAMPDSATNIEALQEMERQELDALVVTDSDSRIKGVLSREQVLSSMMLALANSGD